MGAFSLVDFVLCSVFSCFLMLKNRMPGEKFSPALLVWLLVHCVVLHQHTTAKWQTRDANHVLSVGKRAPVFQYYEK